MSVLSISDVEHLLVCPRCHASLAKGDEDYRCSNPECRYGGAGGFPRAAAWPVLVDFEVSLLNRDEVLRLHGGSPIHRHAATGTLRTLRQLVLGTNRVAKRNLTRFLGSLPRGSSRPIVLVVGGGSEGEGMRALYEDESVEVLGFDIYGSDLTQFIADAHRIPLRSGSVQGVLVQAVLEHVLDPSQVVAEIHRVLTEDGVVYAETPFMQQVHEGPYDFTRFTESGHRYLFRHFEVIDSGAVAGPGTQLLWSMDHLVRSLFRSKVAGNACRAALFWLRFLDRLCDTRYTIDAASGVYFLGRKADEAITPQQMIGYYGGAQR